MGINTQSAKNGLGMNHLHPFFLKFSRGRPLDPHLQEGDIHSRIYTAKGKNLPHHLHVYRSGALETKITQKFWGENQHAIGKKWTQNAPFASIFLKISRGRPPGPPPAGGGFPPPTPSPCGASRRFGYAPRQWTFWIRHCQV